MAIYTGAQFPARYRNGAFVAFHGSWNRAPRAQAGYRAGVAVGSNGSLYVSDTEKGRIWRILYTGETSPAAGPAPPTQTSPAGAAGAPGIPDDPSRGAQLYQQTCAVCHMPGGRGVPGMQPSLLTSPVVSGDVTTLVRAVLQGPAQVLPADRVKYAVQMPPFAAAMNDADLAETLTFVRRAFGRNAGPITAAEVAARRQRP